MKAWFVLLALVHSVTSLEGFSNGAPRMLKGVNIVSLKSVLKEKYPFSQQLYGGDISKLVYKEPDFIQEVINKHRDQLQKQWVEDFEYPINYRASYNVKIMTKKRTFNSRLEVVYDSVNNQIKQKYFNKFFPHPQAGADREVQIFDFNRKVLL